MIKKSPIQEQFIEEYKKCSSDPIYFITKYIKIEHPKHGVIPFKLYEFQTKLLELFHKEQQVVVNKSRQTGISTLSSAYALWIILFNKHKSVLIISKKDDDAKEFLEKIKLAYKSLPDWLTAGVPIVKDNVHMIKLKTGSRVTAVSSAKDSGRSLSLSLLIIDEAAFIRYANDIWKSAKPALARGNGKCIVISTPQGNHNFFYELVQKAKQKDIDPSQWNKFHFFFCHWRQVPEYDQNWYDEIRQQYTDRDWAQEFEGDFLGSGNTVIPVEQLKRIKDLCKQPIHKFNERFEEDPGGKLWIWELPKAHKLYLMGGDTARGDGQDFSTLVVFDPIERKEVAEYRGQLDVRGFAKFASTLGFKYNEAYLVMESNTYGTIVLKDMIELFGYSNLYYHRSHEHINVKKPGFLTSKTSRGRITDGAINMFKNFSLFSERLHKEALTYIWIHDKAKAAPGYNDDLIFAGGLAIGNYDAMLEDNPIFNDEKESSRESIFYEGDIETPDFKFNSEKEVIKNEDNNEQYTPDEEVELFIDSDDLNEELQNYNNGAKIDMFKRFEGDNIEKILTQKEEKIDNTYLENQFGFNFLYRPKGN